MLESLLFLRNRFPVYKPLAQALNDFTPAILLSELCNQFDRCAASGELGSDGYFPCTFQTMQNETSLNRDRQMKGLSTLEEIGLIEMKLKGAPPKRSFRLASDFAERLQRIQIC